MYFKKTALLSLALFSLPLISYADLSIWNYTNEASSAKITSGTKHYCSLDFGIYTPPVQPNGQPGKSYADDGSINFLCITSLNKTCEADIYDTANCTGNVIAKATLNLTTHTVTNITLQDHKYDFEIVDGTLIKIFYAS